jgi:hypothetical protein
MNKNIFRALRRELKEAFECYLSKVLNFNPKSKRNFLRNVAKFSSYLLRSAGIFIQKKPEYEKELLTNYLGILLNFCHMKKKLKNNGESSMIREVNTLLYSYSHRRFFKFLEVKEVRVIVQSLLDHVGVEEFVQRHEAMNKYNREYSIHVKKMMETLQR